MDGSTHSVVIASRPRLHGARALIIALIVVTTVVASFSFGRLSARSDDVGPTETGTSQVVGDGSGPPLRDGDVKRG
ncbi:MAG TPA: hypothetical protein VG993_01035 [Actinomycetota bacterium]|jgi:hypothetical protein|nr:hypothetical protein [Actinomycetota bacterium]